MRVEIVPDGGLERVGMLLGKVPVPLLQTLHTVVLARAVMVATRLELFDALADEPLTLEQLGAARSLPLRPLRVLVHALVGGGHLAFSGTHFRLTRLSRRWLLKTSPGDLRASVLFAFQEWELVAGLEDFVRTGRKPTFYETLNEEAWGVYQRGMAANARLLSAELVRRVPSLSRARRMLDLGGGHGHHSAALCRRWPELRAVVMDLPGALGATSARDLQGVGDRLTFSAGDATRDDLGEDAFDVVLLAQLVHHFDAATNQALFKRVERCLRPGGLLIVQEWNRNTDPRAAPQADLLGDLFFSLVSETGPFSLDEIEAWSQQVGLHTQRRLRMLTGPSMSLFVARKTGKAPRLASGVAK